MWMLAILCTMLVAANGAWTNYGNKLSGITISFNSNEHPKCSLEAYEENSVKDVRFTPFSTGSAAGYKFKVITSGNYVLLEAEIFQTSPKYYVARNNGIALYLKQSSSPSTDSDITLLLECDSALDVPYDKCRFVFPSGDYIGIDALFAPTLPLCEKVVNLETHFKIHIPL